MILVGVFLFVALNLWIKTRSFLDPDFGWHLRMGEILRAQGIPQGDPFSYTMPSYPFVDHEWLTNIIFSLLYSSIGLDGMSVLFVLLALGAIGLQFVFSHKRWRIIPFVLAAFSLIPFLGIRPQVFSWVLFSVLLVVILHEKFWKKFKWFLPLLILLWTNLHGSFPLGIVVIGVAIVCHSWRQTRNPFSFASRSWIPAFARMTKNMLYRKDWIVVVLCVLATFINPYGWRVWWEVGMQVSDSTLRWAIQEWLPAFFLFNLPFLVLLSISTVLVWKYRKQFQPINLALYGTLLLMGLSSSRHVPFWLFIALPMTSQALQHLYEEVSKHREGKKRFAVVSKVLTIGVIAMVSIDFLMMLPQAKYAHLSRSPQEAVAFLKSHPSQGMLFNEYGLGGYLIWQYPDKKVFIDGRMPSWRWENAPLEESNNAFAEYEIVMSGSPEVEKILKNYGVDTVILLRQEDPERLARLFRKITPLRLVNKPRLRKQLQRMGMREVYKDGLVIIYRK